jgi:hypothetical protein
VDAPVVLDTSVLIEFLRGRPGAAEFVEGLSATTCVSAITVVELFAGAASDEACSRLDGLLSAFDVVPLTPKIARDAGLIRRAHGTAVPDAVIAATAAHLGAELLTFNPRHFRMLEGVREPYDRRRPPPPPDA